MTGFLLTEADRDLLKAMLEQFRQQGINQSRRPRMDLVDVKQTPEIYVAKAVTGIPALAAETGTGTEDDPGSADCNVYQLVVEGNSLPELEFAGFTREVFNLSDSAVPADSWVLAVRDKFGRWFAVPTTVGSSGTNSSCRVTIKGTGDQDIPSDGSDVAINFAPAATSYDPWSWDSDNYLVPSAGTGSGTDQLVLPFDGEYEVTFQMAPSVNTAGGGTNISVAAAVTYYPDAGPFVSLPVCTAQWTRISLLYQGVPTLNGSGRFMGKASKLLDLRMACSCPNAPTGKFRIVDATGVEEQNYLHVRRLGPLINS